MTVTLPAAATSKETKPCTPLPSSYYTERLSDVSAGRKPSPIWDLLPVEDTPGMLSMLAGKPNPATFPFKYIHLGVRSPTDKTKIEEIAIEGKDLDAALQYGVTTGFTELVDWVRDMMAQVHGRDPDSEAWRVSLGPGSQDLLYKAMNALVNPGDTVIVEGPTYPGVTPIMAALSCQYAVVDVDDQGAIATDMEKMLANWDRSVKPFPKVFYTIPFGCNPSGVTTSYARRIQLLEIARKYDIIILEDDPYYFLYYGKAPKPPSYFTLEKQLGGEVGRVLRFDSFSKVLAAGFRLGWITGPSTLVAAIERHNSCSVVQPSSLTQAVTLPLLKQWKISGFLAHTVATASFYRQRRDAFEACLNRHLADLAEWTVPEASMFFWLKLRLPPTVRCQNLGSPGEEDEGDSAAFIRDKAMHRGVLLLPGANAYVDDRSTARVRVSFSLLSDEQMEEAVRRLAEVLREESTS
ncbi:TdiD protein [Coprinopsis marcescibilis]|uniref:TdiD protein n=1 Tax=Coprinopsis marcescibilis TaxID=230819 RepID=A0A5C3KWV6_COPMA|nr:TdiD protein [Coprinopsis marcescibilis]